MVKAGIDIVLATTPSWKKKRIGLLTNDAALTSRGVPSRKALHDAGFNLIKIFSPEHGLTATGADGAPMQDQQDPLTRLPVISLYGEKLAPRVADLSDLDLLLFDIPDAGSRFYTYLWTLTYCLEVCALNGTKLLVLDRPNPLSGLLSLASGPFLDEEKCGSFIGRWSIPIRHSCTLGELANYFNVEKKIGCSLEVICCENWHRHYFFTDTGWMFTPPSPALQRFENILFYPGTCLLEAANLHEGRGTDNAFSLVAAPWLIPKQLRSNLLLSSAQGISYHETDLVSTTVRYFNERCYGLGFSVSDIRSFDPLPFGFLLIKSIKDLFPSFLWDVYPTAVNPTGQLHLDRLVGVSNAAEWFELPMAEFQQVIKEQCAVAERWSEKVSPFLLYR
jgi:uncharacterized protein YbbC (DUF1343 family)